MLLFFIHKHYEIELNSVHSVTLELLYRLQKVQWVQGYISVYEMKIQVQNIFVIKNEN